MADLARVQALIATFLESHGVGEDADYAVRLAVEELVSNVIRYAYDDTRPHRIDVQVVVSGPAIELTIEDDGRPFDPNETPPVVAPASIDHAAEGGRGLLLVRELAGPIRYERQNGRNRVAVSIDRSVAR